MVIWYPLISLWTLIKANQVSDNHFSEFLVDGNMESDNRFMNFLLKVSLYPIIIFLRFAKTHYGIRSSLYELLIKANRIYDNHFSEFLVDGNMESDNRFMNFLLMAF